ATQNTEQAQSTTAPEIVQNTAPIVTNTGNVLTDFVAKNAAGKNVTPKTYTKDQNGKWTATNKNGVVTNVNNEGIINQLKHNYKMKKKTTKPSLKDKPQPKKGKWVQPCAKKDK